MPTEYGEHGEHGELVLVSTVLKLQTLLCAQAQR